MQIVLMMVLAALVGAESRVARERGARKSEALRFQRGSDIGHNLEMTEEIAIRQAVRREGKEIATAGITVITRENCPFSEAMLRTLKEHGSHYTHIVAKDTSTDSLLNTMRKYQRRFPAVYVDGVYVGGYAKALKDETFLELLNSKGVRGPIRKVNMRQPVNKS